MNMTVCRGIINSNSFLLFAPPTCSGFIDLMERMNREKCVRANNTEKAKFIRNRTRQKSQRIG